MIIDLRKKKKVIFAVVVTVAAAAVFKLGSDILSEKLGSISVQGQNIAKGKRTVIIDAGHGGMDGGAVGIDGVIEKNINLSVSQKLKNMLELNGYNVVMTRPTDESIHDSDAITVREKKHSDLENRLKITEKYDDAYFISIHQNYFGEPSCDGTQIFYGPKNSESEKMANIFREKFKTCIQPNNEREIKEAGDNLYLMYYSKNPAVLVECGFISNPEEAKKLQDDSYQNTVAFVIMNSLLEYDASKGKA